MKNRRDAKKGPMQPRVALVFPAQLDFSHSVIRGVAEELEVRPGFAPTPIHFIGEEVLANIAPANTFSGIISLAAWNNPVLRRAVDAGIPVINCGTDWSKEKRVLSCFVDQKLASQFAIQHFKKAGLRRVYFLSHELGIRKALVEKADDFRAQAIACGLETGSFEMPGDPINENPGRLTDFSRETEVADLLHALPKPCGIFCEDDNAAVMAAGVGCVNNIAIPSELAILGYGDQIAGRHNMIPISSFPMGGRRIGKMAARLMKKWLSSGKKPSSPRPLAPLPIVVRESTGGTTHNIDIEAARRMIESEACSGLKTKEILSLVSVTRKTLTEQYKRAYGETPAEAIRRVRFETGRSNLLSPAFASVSEVSVKCGFSSITSFSNFFQRQTGMSPLEYRSTMLS
jgi:LacI family transcriptional regulator